MPSLPTRLAAVAILCLGLSANGGLAHAATIGVVAPRSGPYAVLGAQVYAGARAAAQAQGDTLVEIDEPCDEQGGTSVAEALLRGNVEAAVGFLCVETLTTALPLMASRSVPAITISVRSRILMEDALRNGWPLYRMAPAEGAEADKIAATIADRWKAEPIAFIDDGTIYGRELVNAVRQKLEPLGIMPAFSDTLRPGQEQQIALVRRLQKAGATHAFVGADRNDLAIIARDAAAEGSPLKLLGGDVLRAANRPIPLRDGVLAVSLPTYALEPSAASAVGALAASGGHADGHALPAYAAVQVVHRARAQVEGVIADLAAIGSVDTVIGPIGFGRDHELVENPYRLLEWRGSEFFPAAAATE